MHRCRALAGALLLVLAPLAAAAEFRTIAEPATVLYDAPSTKAKPTYVLGRDTPVEVIVPLEGWVKVRDYGGTIGWVERRALAERRTLVVRAPVAEILAAPDPESALVFRAERGVLLDLAEPVTSAASAGAPGWIRVRHRDGQGGFVRVAQVFGV